MFNGQARSLGSEYAQPSALGITSRHGVYRPNVNLQSISATNSPVTRQFNSSTLGPSHSLRSSPIVPTVSNPNYVGINSPPVYRRPYTRATTNPISIPSVSNYSALSLPPSSAGIYSSSYNPSISATMYQPNVQGPSIDNMENFNPGILDHYNVQTSPPRRSQNMSRLQLMRQHRSLDGNELLASGPEWQLNPEPQMYNIDPGQQVQDPYANMNYQTQATSLGAPPVPPLPAEAMPSQQPLPFIPRMPLRDPYQMSFPALQREFEVLQHEYDLAIQKLNSTMNSIKTFWSPELKKERTARKEESHKLSVLNEQLKLNAQDSQRQTNVVRQLQDELQCQYELHRTIRDADLQSVPRDEYDAVRHERDRQNRELALLRDTLRELEVQIETQRQTLISRDDSIKKLLDMLQNKGLLPYNAAQDRFELEQTRSRAIELEHRCRHLESSLAQRELDVRSLQEQCVSASQQLGQMQIQNERLQLLPADERGDPGAYQALLDNKDQRIGELENALHVLQEELTHVRTENFQQMNGMGRELTDKTVSQQEYSDMKLQLEKLELELTQKQTEVETLHTRLITADEQVSDIKKHLVVLKDTSTAKEQQTALLQSDIEALRAKLEAKNETIEQKGTEMREVQQERQKLQSEIASLTEQLKVKDSKVTILQRKCEGLEDMLKDSQQEIELTRARMAAAPAVVQQQQLQEHIEQISREHERIMTELKRERDLLEQERFEEMETHSREVRNLRQTIDMLQKELQDKQMLIESQSSKIEEVERDSEFLKMRSDATGGGIAGKGLELKEKEIQRLQEELHQARSEVERLLKIITTLEIDKGDIVGKMKDLEDHKLGPGGVPKNRQLRETKGVLRRTNEQRAPSGTDPQAILQQKEQRIEELEEALRESVSITAEREYAIAQHKQQAQQAEHKLQQTKEECSRLRRELEETKEQLNILRNSQSDKDGLIRSLRHERKKHLEEVLELKQEALLAAISEKDAHIALLEIQAAGRQDTRAEDEMETLRKHKEKLMKKLKEENAKRVKLMSDHKDVDLSTPLARDLKTSPADQIIQAIRFVELQKKKLRVFIDQLVACVLELDPELLSGLPRTQQSQGVEIKLLSKLTHEQLLLELQQRETDSLHLQHYANQLLQRLAHVQPELVSRALKLLDSFGDGRTVDNTESQVMKVLKGANNNNILERLGKSNTIPRATLVKQSSRDSSKGRSKVRSVLLEGDRNTEAESSSVDV